MIHPTFGKCKCCEKLLNHASAGVGFDITVMPRDEIIILCRQKNICPGCRASLTPDQAENAVMVWIQLTPKSKEFDAIGHLNTCRKLIKKIDSVNTRARNSV
jgi:hypothetical protein